MKKQFAVCAVLLVLALVALPAHGQTQSIKVSIPFAFNVDDKPYPAGEYAFSRVRENVLVLEKDGQSGLGLFLANRVSGHTKMAQVRFECYEQQCFLSQVWIPGIDDGFEARRSRAEQEVATRVSGKYVALVGKAPQR
jgi:hypothetical protein